MTSSDLWDEATAATYDADCAGMFAPDVLGPTVDLLAELAGPGPALELAAPTCAPRTSRSPASRTRPPTCPPAAAS